MTHLSEMKELLIICLLILFKCQLGLSQDLIKNDSANYIGVGSFRFYFEVLDTINDFKIDSLSMPKYTLGTEEFQKHISKYTRFPMEILEDTTINLEGFNKELVISFVIDKTGSIKDLRILQGFHPSAENVMIKMILTLKKFEPGRYKRKPIDIKLILRLIYRT